ncbi:hypothetical protein FGIG_10024 [Fasciola gigantica]|uniref:Uncharacterized protein n=1 Tax=Fasciola gigantica TaxID=46835 RepID=A0A504YP74_FASGI|nr:hypothetical protein FGIG_10024 [Fasciola gigantica]
MPAGRTVQLIVPMSREDLRKSSKREVLERGEFYVEKWVPSQEEVLQAIAEHDAAAPTADVGLKPTPVEKTPGLERDIQQDTSCLQFDLIGRALPSRGDLSLISAFQDTLGLASLAIRPTNSLLQNPFREGLHCD